MTQHHTQGIRLAAEFVYGLPPETWQIIQGAGLLAYEINGDHWSSRSGSLVSGDDYWVKTDDLFRHMTQSSLDDQSFSAFLAPHLSMIRNGVKQLDTLARFTVLSSVDNASLLKVSSARKYHETHSLPHVLLMDMRQ